MGNEITWDYGDLLPFTYGSIEINLNTLPPPTNESGDKLEFTATILPVDGDSNPENNVFNWEQIVVNAQDPNDKLVAQGAEILEDQVGEYLDYIVRFQNVGTASAINVRIDDVLSDNLDWSSLRLLSSSHDFEAEILNGNELSFIYNDINLPPVSIDPEGSNGYIAFKVRTLSTLEVGDVIENKANIFFDFNAPIETNTVVTQVVKPLSVNDSSLKDRVIVVPNPVRDIFSVYISDSFQLEKVVLFSILGDIIVSSNSTNIDVSKLSNGIYFLQIKTDVGTITKKIVKE